MKTLISAAWIVLALAGCGSVDSDNAWVNQRCRNTVDVPSWDRCVTQANAMLPARRAAQAAQEQANDNTAAMMLLGATAFTNGYNSGTSGQLPMVNYGGRLMMYSVGPNGMVQGY